MTKRATVLQHSYRVRTALMVSASALGVVGIVAGPVAVAAGGRSALRNGVGDEPDTNQSNLDIGLKLGAAGILLIIAVVAGLIPIYWKRLRER